MEHKGVQGGITQHKDEEGQSAAHTRSHICTYPATEHKGAQGCVEQQYNQDGEHEDCEVEVQPDAGFLDPAVYGPAHSEQRGLEEILGEGGEGGRIEQVLWGGGGRGAVRCRLLIFLYCCKLKQRGLERVLGEDQDQDVRASRELKLTCEQAQSMTQVGIWVIRV